MKQKLFSTMLLAVFILVIGCKDDPNEPQDTTPFPFLKIGNQWEYQLQRSYDGHIYMDTILTITLDSVATMTNEDMGIVYDVYYSKEIILDTKIAYIFNKTDSSLIIPIFDNSPLLYWNYYLGQKYNDDKYEVTSLSRVIDVFGEYYDCIEVSVDLEMSGAAYINKKYGLIYQEASEPDNPNGQKNITKLKSKNF